MASQAESTAIELPSLPAQHGDFIAYLRDNKDTPVAQLLEPYKRYDNEMRKVFAQQPDHAATEQPSSVPVFDGHEGDLRIRARELTSEDDQTKSSFIMPLKDNQRLPDGSPAIVQSVKDFRTNFNVFSESSLIDLNWDNVVAAGSAAVTSLLAVPEKYAGTKRALREYYHEKIAPASDVDLFLYGLNEDQAKEKIKQIETSIRDAILTETTTIRTKNAITIASQHPTRHVQVVLRIYKSISEILTGFDVDCSCVAYDGKQVYASPRALAAFITQTNTIDLTRRSPSYESRLSKYAHRGFEIFWPELDRDRIDPTIFERSFGRTEGLARLLILEKLPNSEDRDAYLDQRRAERGRPAINRWRMKSAKLGGNIKDAHEDEVADWVNEEDVASYHTFTIPYGPKYHARKIEKLLFTKDMLLNAEWNLPKDREVHLHRHPAFFGSAEDVFHDCCGSCPEPKTTEEKEVFEEESKIYVRGDIDFLKDDPGRQAIGSFHPITPAGWTEMAYVGNTARLCQAIVECDVEYVLTWLEQEDNDPNTRDYTGRTPLHLAVTDSSPEVVQALIDANARLVARLVDGRTALHLAAIRGDVEIISALLRRSEANEEVEQKKLDDRRATKAAASLDSPAKSTLNESSADHDQYMDTDEGADSDAEMLDLSDEDSVDATTENSMVKIKPAIPEADDKALDGDENKDDPDVYDVNVLTWDTAASPLHLAIANGHTQAVRCLVQDFGADLLLPVKHFNDHDKSARAAVLTLVLALQLPIAHADAMMRVLIELGASSAQADVNQATAFQYTVVEQPELIQTLVDIDHIGVSRALNHMSVSGWKWSPSISSPLMTAINARDSLTALRLLSEGAKSEIDFGAYIKAYQTKNELSGDSKYNKDQFQKSLEQPVVCAVQCELPDVAALLIEQHGVDPNTLTKTGWTVLKDDYTRNYTKGSSLLDEVRKKIGELATWKPKDNDRKAPAPLRPDSQYLSGLTQGTYAWWSAQKQIAEAQKEYHRELKSFNEFKSLHEHASSAEPEKQAAVEAMLAQFRILEAKLVDKGAKTFKELYPDIKEAEERRGYEWEPKEPETFQVEFNFQLPTMTDAVQERYVRLFESAWKGDLKTTKELTLLPWKTSDGEEQPPIQLAVMNQHNLSPLAIAVLRGHLDLATAMMEIAEAQYVPPDEPKRERHRLIGGQGSEDGDSDSEAQVVSELVDDIFTVETIGQVSTQTKSRIPPLSLLLWPGPVQLFGGDRAVASSHSSVPAPTDLLQFAIHYGDMEMLEYLLSLAEDITQRVSKPDTGDVKQFFALPSSVYEHAIAVDLPHILAKLIKRTGAGLPMDHLVKQFGIEVKEKPKYYQGLSVHGVKRQDWAARGTKYRRNYSNFTPRNSSRPPLLQAAYDGSLETVEWLLSDAPIRCYNDFARANAKDKRIQQLDSLPGGFEACIRQFLGARSHLVIHCCVMGSPTPEAMNLLRYLVKTMPECIDAKSQDSMTPLLVAYRAHRVEAAKILIEAGANQTARDSMSNNLVHSLLIRQVTSEDELAELPPMLDLIDKRLLSGLFCERSGESPGSLTPLAQFIDKARYRNHNSASDFSEAVLRMLLGYSKGIELNLINGEGHTPLHVTVREINEVLTRILLEQDPTQILRENATGRTPFELAEDSRIASVVGNPPDLTSGHRHYSGRVNRTDVTNGICERDPAQFSIGPDHDARSPRQKIWELLQETKAKLVSEGQSQRKLVTLNEANEVARRLAASKPTVSRSPRYQAEDIEYDGGGQQDARDEVQIWLPM